MAPEGTRSQSGLRTGLQGLTTRGRSFLAAGVTAVLCSYLLGQEALLRVGVLLAALPLACAVLLLRTRYRVASGRRLTPHRVSAGQEAQVRLRVDNVSRVPTGLLMLEDLVPYVLGPRPRFVLDRVEPRGYREVSYRVRSDLRGRYPLGPLQLRLSDPFGMCELTRAFTLADVLTVVPRVQTLPPIRPAGDWNGFGDSRTRAVALAGEDDVVPRGYRHGDDLRRVHWKATARYGELMVRREEQPLRSRATVLLDTRAAGHCGAGPDSSFEWAVGTAASVAVHLLERGHTVRLLTDAGRSVPGSSAAQSSGSPSEASGLLLDALAVVHPSDEEGLSGAEDALRRGGEGLVVAVLGALDDEQVARLGRLRHRTGAAVAFLLDVGTWPGLRHGLPSARAADTDSHERLLSDSGWTVLRAHAGDSAAVLWQRADRHARPGPEGVGRVPGFTVGGAGALPGTEGDPL